jgi:hypothetical protein
MDEGQVKTYHLPVKWRIMYAIFAAFCVLCVAVQGLILVRGLLGKHDGGKLMLYFGTPLSFIGALLIMIVYLNFAFFTRLRISPEYIEWQYGGYVRARWDEITRVGTQTWGLRKKIQGIFVKPSFTPPVWLAVPGKEKFIPLEMLVKNWQDSELGQIVRQRAPHIVADELAPKTAE